MKKYIILAILSLIPIFLLTGCLPQVTNFQNEKPSINSEKPIVEPGPIAINLQEITFESECSKLGEQIKGLIEQTNYCTKASDCVYESFGCPFGCYTILSNKIIGAVQKIKEGVNIYDEKCMLCLYDCGGPPKNLSCEKNRCIKNTDETKSNIIDKCDIGRDYVRESELNNFSCTKKPGCEWSHRGGMQEPMYACCPIDIDIAKDLGTYSRCGAEVD